MTIKPFMPQDTRSVTLSVHEGGETQSASVGLWDRAHLFDRGQAGRVIEVAHPAPGSVIQHDGSRTLALTDVEQGITTYPMDDALTGGVDVIAPRQAAKWGDAIFYMLERDRVTGDLIYERGRNSVVVYVTAGPHGYTKAMIAAEAGVSEATITNTWLKNHAVYGRSPEKALAMDPGFILWGAITINQGGNNPKQSHHLYLERGYAYDFASWPANQGWWSRSADGESPLHPMVVSTYGVGHPPTTSRALAALYGPRNVSVNGIEFQAGLSLLGGSNKLLSDFIVRGRELGIQEHVRSGIYRGMIVDAVREFPVDGDGNPTSTWNQPLGSRRSGLYVNGSQSCLIEGMVFDHNGWADGYVVETPGAADTPQPPSMYSHNVYIQASSKGVCFHDVLSARAASMGLMNRPGGTIANSVMLDNNIGGNDLGGNYKQAGQVGEFGLQYRNLITSAAFKRAPTQQGAFNWGFDFSGKGGTALDVIVAHAADPNNPAEMAAKAVRNFGLKGISVAYRHVLERNWSGGDSNIEGLDTDALDATTIQNFAATVLPEGTDPTIANLMAHIRTLGPKARVDMTRAILAYFQTPYRSNMEMPASPTGPVSTIFRPDIRGEGFRWDSDLNWTTGFVPGTVYDDAVNLHGNFARFGRVTAVVSSLTFGGGRLDVTSAKLTALAHTDAADVSVRYCGQYFAPAGADGEYRVSGGRLVFNGAASVDLEIAVDDLGQEAEVILGPDMTIGAGKTLSLVGGNAFVGWDGGGTATLTIGAGGTLHFAALNGLISQLRRFKRKGDDPEPTVAVNLVLAAGSTVTVDSTGMTAGAHYLTGEGVTVTDNGATLPSGVAVTDERLVLTA